MKVISFWRHFVSFVAFALMYLPTAAFSQAPSFSINDVSVEEGNLGSADATFTITLSGILMPMQSYAVMYSTAAGTATGGGTCSGETDFLTTSRIISFMYPETRKTITISVCPDTRAEPNETFFVNLSSASGAMVGDGQGQATIVDNDTPTIRIGNVSQNEGNSGLTNFGFPVTLSNSSAQQVTAWYAVYRDDSDTATAGNSCGGSTDFIGAMGNTATFSPGTTSRTINVSVCGDTTTEPNETFRIVMAQAENAQILNDGGRGTIVNDDVQIPVISIGDFSYSEPDNSRGAGSVGIALMPLTISTANHSGCTIDYTCVSGSATRSTSASTCSTGSDYRCSSGTIAWPAGSGAGRSIQIPVCWDTLREGNETVTIQLSNPRGLLAPDVTAIFTIRDND